MNINFVLRNLSATKTKDNPEGKVRIYVRAQDGRQFDQTARTAVLVNPKWWDAKNQTIKTRVVCRDDERQELDDSLAAIRKFLSDKYYKDKANSSVGKKWLANALNAYALWQAERTLGAPSANDRSSVNPAKSEPKNENPYVTFDHIFDQFIADKKFEEVRRNQYEVIRRAVNRFTAYMKVVRRKKTFVFNVETVDEKVLEDLYNFLRDEHELVKKHPSFYKDFPEKTQSRPRSANTLCDYCKRLKAFFNWCVKERIIVGTPFNRFTYTSELYGDPFQLTELEVRQLIFFDLSDTPEYERQRDVFVFQCCIGCRVGDLMAMTRANIVGNRVEYIPRKTKRQKANTIVVPLNQTAKGILHKYSGLPGNKILPIISRQKYNDYLKIIFKKVGLTRTITKLDPHSREEVHTPLYDVCSSHLARRTFATSIMNKVKDAYMVSSLTGHAPGSRALYRYLGVSDKSKQDMIDSLDY